MNEDQNAIYLINEALRTGFMNDTPLDDLLREELTAVRDAMVRGISLDAIISLLETVDVMEKGR